LRDWIFIPSGGRNGLSKRWKHVVNSLARQSGKEPVDTADEAYTYEGYYLQRWKIERFHCVLKRGCTIEKLQERSIDKSLTIILMYSVIAVKLLTMTYEGRLVPELSCSLFLGEEDWQPLYCVANKRKKEPKKPYPIKEAID
jgi:hypothetical protein